MRTNFLLLLAVKMPSGYRVVIFFSSIFSDMPIRLGLTLTAF